MAFGDAHAEEVALPDGWRWVALRDVCDVSPKTTFDQLASDDLISFIPMAAVEELTGRMDTSNLRPVADAKSGYTRFSSGDVIFAKITPCMENGKIAVVPPLAHGVAFGSSEYHVLRPRPELDARYLFHYLAQQTFRNDARRHMSGAVGQQRVPAGYMRHAHLPLPPLDQQQRIVALIEELFGEIEAGEQELAAAKTDLGRYRRAVLKAAVTGELTRDWRNQNPPNETGADLLAHILKERRARWEDAERAKFAAKGQTPKNDAWKSRYPEPVAPNANDLPELPEGWMWASLPQLGEFGRGKSKHRPRNDPSLYGGAYPFIQTGDVRQSGGRITSHAQTYSEAGLAQSKLWPAGTVCITIAANIAASAILTFDACFPDSVVGLVPTDDAIGLYAEFFIRTARDDLDRYAPATAQKNINLDILEKMAVPLPSFAELSRIQDVVTEALLCAEETERQVEERAHEASHLRQSILAAAFSGKLLSKLDHSKNQEAA